MHSLMLAQRYWASQRCYLGKRYTCCGFDYEPASTPAIKVPSKSFLGASQESPQILILHSEPGWQAILTCAPAITPRVREFESSCSQHTFSLFRDSHFRY